MINRCGIQPTAVEAKRMKKKKKYTGAVTKRKKKEITCPPFSHAVIGFL